MAFTAEQLEAQLDALKKARASGALIVKHGDTSVTYRSIAEIEKAIGAIEDEIAEANGATRRPRYIQQGGKGY